MERIHARGGRDCQQAFAISFVLRQTCNNEVFSIGKKLPSESGTSGTLIPGFNLTASRIQWISTSTFRDAQVLVVLSQRQSVREPSRTTP